MKRFKIVGLCLMAVFALTAIMASSASAGQFGTCIKKKGAGNYEGKYCEKKAAEPGKGNSEWVPNAAAIKTLSEGGASALKGGAGEIACKKGSNVDEITGATTNKELFTFHECTLKPFELPCKNAEIEIEEGKGKNAKKVKVGVINTYPLKSHLIDHGEKGPSGKEPASGEVWNVIEAEGMMNAGFTGPGPYLAAFECGPVPFEVTGSVSGVINKEYVNAKLKKGKVKAGKAIKPTYKETYSKEGGEQDLLTTFFNPETMKVETGASVQEGLNEIAVESLPKGFEISSLGL
jgi:hypothetical protein